MRKWFMRDHMTLMATSNTGHDLAAPIGRFFKSFALKGDGEE